MGVFFYWGDTMRNLLNRVKKLEKEMLTLDEEYRNMSESNEVKMIKISKSIDEKSETFKERKRQNARCFKTIR